MATKALELVRRGSSSFTFAKYFVSQERHYNKALELACSYLTDEQVKEIADALPPQADLATPQPMQEPVGWSPEAKKKAWDFLKEELKNPDDPWTVAESSTYFGFFCWGIEAARQWALDQAPIHVENVYKRGDKYFAWIGDDYVQIYTAPVQQVPDASPPVLITDDEMSAFRRFSECAQDGEGHDVPKKMMKRLSEIGLLRHCSAGYYESTDFGLAVLSGRYTAPKSEQFRNSA